MSWGELLQREIDYTYAMTEKLLNEVDDDTLNWKPSADNNWMTTAQVLMHITNACGATFKGFVTGDWGMPEGMDASDLSMEDMLPSAEKMPLVGSVAEAKKLLAEDKQLAIDMLAKITEDDLVSKPAPAPWDPRPMKLGHRLLGMIGHLTAHKSQLFYYLKLQGKPVNTGHLWGGHE